MWVVHFTDKNGKATVAVCQCRDAALKSAHGLRQHFLRRSGTSWRRSSTPLISWSLTAPTCAGSHHHLLIDTELPPLDKPIPNDFNHLDFSAGQTEAEVTLKPGPHTLP